MSWDDIRKAAHSAWAKLNHPVSIEEIALTFVLAGVTIVAIKLPLHLAFTLIH